MNCWESFQVFGLWEGNLLSIHTHLYVELCASNRWPIAFGFASYTSEVICGKEKRLNMDMEKVYPGRSISWWFRFADHAPVFFRGWQWGIFPTPKNSFAPPSPLTRPQTWDLIYCNFEEFNDLPILAHQ